MVPTPSGVTASSKLGGRSTEGSGEGVFPSPPGELSGEGAIFLFCDLEMAYFGEFRGAKFKVFFIIVSSLSVVWVDSVAHFGFSR